MEIKTKLSLLGLTDEEIDAFGDDIPFRVLADAEVAYALYRRATGYESTEESVSDGPKGQTVSTRTVQVAPEYRAALSWLERKRPDLWGEKIKPAVRVEVEQLPLPLDFDA